MRSDISRAGYILGAAISMKPVASVKSNHGSSFIVIGTSDYGQITLFDLIY